MATTPRQNKNKPGKKSNRSDPGQAGTVSPDNPRGLRDIPFPIEPATAAERRRARDLLAMLWEQHPDAHCELDYSSPHELLIATILSAQATDVGVNKATPELFKTFPTPADYAEASPEAIEPYIRTIGLFRNNAKSVHAAMTQIVERHGGEVPDTMDDLLALRGVARKTANVVLGNAFGIQVGFVVDTHIERLATRYGLVEPGITVTMIERRLMALFPRESWCDASHLLIFQGRRACKARMNGCACDSNPVCKRFGRHCELRVTAKASS